MCLSVIRICKAARRRRERQQNFQFFMSRWKFPRGAQLCCAFAIKNSHHEKVPISFEARLCRGTNSGNLRSAEKVVTHIKCRPVRESHEKRDDRGVGKRCRKAVNLLMAFSVCDKVNSFLWPINYENDSVAVVVVWRQREENASRPGIALSSDIFLLFARCSLPFGQCSFFIISTSF